MRLSPALGGAACALLLLGGLPARADLIQWSYSWSRSPSEVHADSPGTGYLSLTDEKTTNVQGSSYLVATNLQAHSTASAASPDVFTNEPYTLSLTLKDQASGKSGTVSFGGVFNGTLTAESSNVTSTFSGPTTQQLVLGDHEYTVTIGPFSPPGPTGASNSGSISARAEVSVSTIAETPEPGTAVLASLAVAGSLVGARLRAGRRGWRRGRCS